MFRSLVRRLSTAPSTKTARGQASVKPSFRCLHLESLEDRRLLSTSTTLAEAVHALNHYENYAGKPLAIYVMGNADHGPNRANMRRVWDWVDSVGGINHLAFWNTVDGYNETDEQQHRGEFIVEMRNLLNQVPLESDIILLGYSYGAHGLLEVTADKQTFTTYRFQSVDDVPLLGGDFPIPGTDFTVQCEPLRRRIDFLGVLDPVNDWGLREGYEIGNHVEYVFHRWQNNFLYPLNHLDNHPIADHDGTAYLNQSKANYRRDANGDIIYSFEVGGWLGDRLGSWRPRIPEFNEHSGIRSDDWIEQQIIDVLDNHIIHNPPISNAGENVAGLNLLGQRLRKGEEFTLDGSASKDPIGQGLSYRWKLLRAPDRADPPYGSGPGRFVGSANVAQPTFLPKTYGDFEFELEVTDSRGLTSTDTITVTIFDEPLHVTVYAPADVPLLGKTISYYFDAAGGGGTPVEETWNWGDGSEDSVFSQPEQRQVRSHRFRTTGDLTVHVTFERNNQGVTEIVEGDIPVFVREAAQIDDPTSPGKTRVYVGGNEQRNRILLNGQSSGAVKVYYAYGSGDLNWEGTYAPTGSILVDSRGEGDEVTVDFSNGNPIPDGGLTLNTGYRGDTSAYDDTLVLQGGAFDTVTYQVTPYGSGDSQKEMVVNLDGREIRIVTPDVTSPFHLVDLTTATERVVRIDASHNQPVQYRVTDDDEVANGLAVFDGAGSLALDPITFAVPQETLSVYGDNLSNSISAHSIDSTFTGLVRLVGAGGGDTLDAQGYGNSTELVGGDGNDTILAGSGDDSLYGNAGVDTLDGGQGNDALDGGPGNDTLHGGGGEDALTGGEGDDFLYGDSGNDIVTESADADWILSDAALTGAGVDTLVSVEAALLAGGGSDNAFDTTAFSFATVGLFGLGGTDRIVATGSGQWLIDDETLTYPDGRMLGVENVEHVELVGEATDDTFVIAGFAQSASLSGQGGNDVFQLPGEVLKATSVDGGQDVDTLQLVDSGNLFDFHEIPVDQFTQIERMDITGDGRNRLILNVDHVLNISSPTNTLIVVGSADDQVNIDPGCTFTGTQTIDSQTYSVYTQGAAVLLVNDEVTIRIDPSLAFDDAYTVDEDQPLVVAAAAGVLENDNDQQFEAPSALLLVGPSNAEDFTLNADGSFTYTPTEEFHGSDSFSYVTRYGTYDSNMATVEITVSSVNDAPLADDDAYIVGEGQTIVTTIGVLANDIDVDADSLTAELVSGPSFALSFDFDPTSGCFEYVDDPHTTVVDSFTYRVYDGTTYSEIVTVTVSNPPAVGNRVWNDLNDNGVQDPGEPGVAGAVVKIFLSRDDVVANDDDLCRGIVVTDANGEYRFGDLVTGVNYYLSFHAPVGGPAYAFSAPDAAADDIDSDVDSVGFTPMLTLSAAQVEANLDAGLVGSAPEFGFAFGLGDNLYDAGHALAVDEEGNVHVAGYFKGSVDFDPGPGVYTLTSTGYRDVFVAKYSSTGGLIWARAMGGPGQDEALDIALGADGSVYLTGMFYDWADFDPGPGMYHLESPDEQEDAFILKLDADGDFVWAGSIVGDAMSRGEALAVGPDGDVYLGGWFSGTADVDPGPGFHSLAAVYVDGFVCRLNSEDGSLQWASQLRGEFRDWLIPMCEIWDIAVGSNGKVYTTGDFDGHVDFDPGTAESFALGNRLDVFVSVLNANDGSFHKVLQMGGSATDIGTAIAIGPNGNVHVTGSFQSDTTKPSADWPDFDPGPGVHHLLSDDDSSDAFVCKLDPAGNLVWAKSIGGDSGDTGYDVAVSAEGAVYTTGYFKGTADFDPAPSQHLLTAPPAVNEYEEAFLSRVDPNGHFVWAGSMGGVYEDRGCAIAVANGNIYTTGRFSIGADFDPSDAEFNLHSNGWLDAFVSKVTESADTLHPTVVGRSPTPGALANTYHVDIEVTFSEVVQGVDAADMVLTGTAAVSASVGTPTDQGGNVWRFPVCGLVGGTLNVSLAPDANDIVNLFGNDLAQVEWSYSIEAAAGETRRFNEKFRTLDLGGSRWSFPETNALIKADNGTSGPSNPLGAYAANLDGSHQRLRSLSLDLSNCSSGRLIYWVEPGGNEDMPADNHDLLVQYKASDGTWKVIRREDVRQFDNGQDFVFRELALPADALHSNFQFEFFANRIASEDWFVDSIFLYATANLLPTASVAASHPQPYDDSAPWFYIHACDADQGNPLAELSSISAVVKHNGVTVNSWSSTFVFDKNLYTSMDHGLGTYEITVTVEDACGAQDTATSSYTLRDDDSTPPQISIDGSIGTQTVDEIQWFTWYVTDLPDTDTGVQSPGGSVDVEITRDGSIIYSVSGILAPDHSGSFNFDSFGLGTFEISVTATDGDDDRTGDAAVSGPVTRTVLVTGFDFGDAPASYSTLVATNGARHIPLGPSLGAYRDTEPDGQPTLAADGDDTTGTPDDEDGVTLPVLTASTFGTTAASLDIDLQNADASSNRLDAWIDFNQDGDWDDLGEQIFANYNLGATNGIQTLSFTVPQDTDGNIVYGTTYARFRLSTAGGLLPTGLADDGEVEDYPVALTWFGSPTALPVNAREGSEPQVTTDGAGNWVAVWISAEEPDDPDNPPDPEGDILVSHSNNAGDTWSTPTLLSNPGTMNSYPQVTTDKAGNWVAVWHSEDSLGGTIGTDWDILVSRSTDAGVTWSAPAALNSNAAGNAADWGPEVATDSLGNWVAVWFSYEDLNGIGTDADILVSRSDDAGATWTAAEALNINANIDSGDDLVPRIVTDGAGNWVAVWRSEDNLDGIGTDQDILVSCSDDAGEHWDYPVPLNTNADTDSGDDTHVQLTSDGAGNWVAVWSSTDNLDDTIGTDADILVSHWDDANHTWTSPVALNRNAGTDSGNDKVPQVTTDGAGNWVAVWHSDDSVCGALGTDRDALVSRSTDGGASWTNPGPLSVDAGSDLGEDMYPQVTTDAAGNWVAVWCSNDGDHSDILFATFSEILWDWGDAPSPYPTLLANVGARHLATGPTLGANRDTEPDGQPTPIADGDDTTGTPDDEDGVTFSSTIMPGQLGASVTVNVQNASSGAMLDAWIDFDGDGIWDGPFEQIADSVAVVNGDNAVTFDVPSDAVEGATYARFRISTLGDLEPGGLAADGEVEDYLIAVSWFGLPQPLNTDATSDTEGDHWVRVATDSKGNWIAVWDTDGTVGPDRDIVFSRSTDAGRTWSDPAALNTASIEDDGEDYRPSIATDHLGNWVVVWLSSGSPDEDLGPDYDLLFSRSTDAGQTWTDPAILNTNAAEDSGSDYDPQVATDSLGNWVVVWDSEDDLDDTIGTDSDILFSRSIDAGQTWSPPAALTTNAQETEGGFDAVPYITADSLGNWITVWSSRESLKESLGGVGLGGEGDILFSRSTDAGQTWTYPAALNGYALTDDHPDHWPKVTTDSLGNWVAVWYSRESLGAIGTDRDILISRSTDAGQTWTEAEALNTNAADDIYDDFTPHVATDSLGNWVAVWFSKDSLDYADTDRDILYSRSTDVGSTWTAPALVGSNAATEPVFGPDPQVITDSLGNWLVPWWTNEDLDGTIGTDYDILYASASSEAFDFGDAPTSYPTLLTNGGARHMIGGPWLGPPDDLPDAEPDGQPDPQAFGDDGDIDPLNAGPNFDDENGVAIVMPTARGSVGSVIVDLTGSPMNGYLNAWIDFDRNGTWDAGEQIFADLLLANGTSHTFDLPVPLAAVGGTSYARFRITGYDPVGTLGPDGLADDGEVEDYQVEIPSAVVLSGTPAADVFEFQQIGNELRVTINGQPPVVFDATSVQQVHLDGLGQPVGESDVLWIHDTAGTDQFVAEPNGSQMVLGTGVQVDNTNFETTYALASGTTAPGQVDTAVLHGSAGSNRLYSYADYSLFTDSPRTFSCRVDGFDKVTANAPGTGRDYAFLYGSPQDDVLDANPERVILNRAVETADATTTTASGFQRAYAYGTNGGADTATLTGSDTTRNRFYGYADYSILTESRRSFYFYARGFDTTTANSPGDGCTYAYLHDSSGVDALTASPASATMNRAAGWSNTTATGFKRVYAYSTRGGDDTATLTGASSGGNYYRGYPTYSTLTDATRSFYHYARGFRSVTAIGAQDAAASSDRAYLYDSGGVDSLGAAFHDGDKYQGGSLTDEAPGETGTYENWYKYFDVVYARSSDGEVNDTVDIDENELAYNLIRTGVW